MPACRGGRSSSVTCCGVLHSHTYACLAEALYKLLCMLWTGAEDHSQAALGNSEQLLQCRSLGLAKRLFAGVLVTLEASAKKPVIVVVLWDRVDLHTGKRSTS